MKKTSTEVKAVDGEGLKGPRRKKPTKRFRVEYMFHATLELAWPWSNKWLKSKMFEVEDQAVAYVEKQQRNPYDRCDYRIIDAHDDRVIMESHRIT